METTISFQKLTSAVSSLPLLLEKKRLIDMHTSLATAILDQIKLRKLDLFFELEEKILSKQTLDKSLKEVSKNTYRVSHLLISLNSFRRSVLSYFFTPAFPKVVLNNLAMKFQNFNRAKKSPTT